MNTKHAMNFRLSYQARTTLSLLEKKLKVTKTTLIEDALQFYAKKNLSERNSLLECVGLFSDRDAEQMLDAVKTSRRNKKLRVDL